MLKKYMLLTMLLLALTGCTEVPQTPPTESAQIPDAPLPTVTAALPAVTEALPPATEEVRDQESITLHSGVNENGTFTKGTLFLGDSQTCFFIEQHLAINDLLGEARYATQCGSQLTAFWDDSIRPTENRKVYAAFSPEFDGMSFREAAEAMGEEATAIYIMWGSNFTENATSQSYVEIVDHLLTVCPNATIHLQTIPWGQVSFITVNQRIQDAYAHYQEVGEPRVLLLDTFTAIGKHIGGDEVHVNGTGREAWYQAIIRHAEDNGLVP